MTDCISYKGDGESVRFECLESGVVVSDLRDVRCRWYYYVITYFPRRCVYATVAVVFRCVYCFHCSQVRMSFLRPSYRLSGRFGPQNGVRQRMESFWRRWRRRDTPRFVARRVAGGHRCIFTSMQFDVEILYPYIWMRTLQVSREVFVATYEAALPKNAGEVAQIATRFLSAARSVREERLALRRGLVQTAHPAPTVRVPAVSFAFLPSCLAAQ